MSANVFSAMSRSGAIVRTHVEANARRNPADFENGGREDFLHGVVDRAHADHAFAVFGNEDGIPKEVVDGGERRLELGFQVLHEVRRHHLAPVPHEEFLAEDGTGFMKEAGALRDRDAKPPGRLRNRTLLVERGKKLQDFLRDRRFGRFGGGRTHVWGSFLAIRVRRPPVPRSAQLPSSLAPKEADEKEERLFPAPHRLSFRGKRASRNLIVSYAASPRAPFGCKGSRPLRDGAHRPFGFRKTAFSGCLYETVAGCE